LGQCNHKVSYKRDEIKVREKKRHDHGTRGLKIEKEVTNQGMQFRFKIEKAKKWIPSEASRRNTALLTPYFEASYLQNFNR
jgi:hypothetical protein